MAIDGSTPIALAVGIWALIVIVALLLLLVLVSTLRQMPELRRYRKMRSM